MKYIPLDANILLATRGLVTTRLEFFEAAFGHSAEEFRMIATMPEHYIIQRRKYENNGAGDWQSVYKSLTAREKLAIAEMTGDTSRILDMMKTRRSLKMKTLLGHYLDENAKVIKG
jgi:hypothetical protein